MFSLASGSLAITLACPLAISSGGTPVPPEPSSTLPLATGPPVYTLNGPVSPLLSEEVICFSKPVLLKANSVFPRGDPAVAGVFHQGADDVAIETGPTPSPLTWAITQHYHPGAVYLSSPARVSKAGVVALCHPPFFRPLQGM